MHVAESCWRVVSGTVEGEAEVVAAVAAAGGAMRGGAKAVRDEGAEVGEDAGLKLTREELWHCSKRLATL